MDTNNRTTELRKTNMVKAFAKSAKADQYRKNNHFYSLSHLWEWKRQNTDLKDVSAGGNTTWHDHPGDESDNSL